VHLHKEHPVARQTDNSLVDGFSRVITNLRISVTDRCNFRCRYCMPEEGMQWLERSALLTYEEIERLVRVFAGLGIRKIRLTGGEPLLRKDLHELVRKIHAIDGITDIAVTTNGVLLEEQAQRLADAGLHRMNISLDALDPARFAAMTRRESFDKVWRGIEAAGDAGLRPIKLNCVLVRGVNDAEIGPFARLVRTRPLVVRFIEFMPLGRDDEWSSDRVVPASEVVARMEAEIGIKLIPLERHGLQPADRFRFADGNGEVGFISSVSEPFCGSCNRVRLTSDGKLRTCLFSLDETDLRALLRSERTDEELRTAIRDAVSRKEAGHLINSPAFVRPRRSMSQIGG
jgi:GTP 3',8-cyclase